MPKQQVFPPPPPKRRTKPYPTGTVVTGFSQNGTFGFPEHRGHGLFVTENEAKTAIYSNSGWRQRGRCISCGQVMEVDCEFLMVKANKDMVGQTIAAMYLARDRIEKAINEYKAAVKEGRVK